MDNIIKPTKEFFIITSVPFVSVEVDESTFFSFKESLERNYCIHRHEESYEERSGITHYTTCYDAVNEYGESLGTVCLIHEVNA